MNEFDWLCRICWCVRLTSVFDASRAEHRFYATYNDARRECTRARRHGVNTRIELFHPGELVKETP